MLSELLLLPDGTITSFMVQPGQGWAQIPAVCHRGGLTDGPCCGRVIRSVQQQGVMHMGDVRVRNLDDEVVLVLKDRARRKGVSLEAELREVLSAEALRPRREWFQRLQEMHEDMRREFGVLPDSTPGIRAWRDGLE